MSFVTLEDIINFECFENFPKYRVYIAKFPNQKGPWAPFVFATRIVQFIFLNKKFPASSHLLRLYSSVFVGFVQKTRCWFSHDSAQIIPNYHETTTHSGVPTSFLSMLWRPDCQRTVHVSVVVCLPCSEYCLSGGYRPSSATRGIPLTYTRANLQLHSL